MQATDMPPNVEEVLSGLPFPAAKVEIISYAGDQDASEETMELLRALPVERYNSIQDINDELANIERQPGNENLWSSRPDLEKVKR